MTDWDRIGEKREAAERARRIGRELTRADDREHIFQFADELDAQADALAATAKRESQEPPKFPQPVKTASEDKGDSPIS
jgi:hypothetical protein